MSSKKGTRAILWWMLPLVAVFFAAAALTGWGRLSHGWHWVTPQEAMKATIGRRPLVFEANRGQAGSEVRFMARGAGYAFSLTPEGSVLQMARLGDPDKIRNVQGGMPGNVPATTLRMHFAGGNRNPKIVKDGAIRGYSNYYIGQDESKWHTAVPSFDRVRYKDVYPGIDVAYYGNQRELEHDFIVRPGVDPAQIRLSYSGAQRIEVNGDGELVLHTAAGDVQQKKPVAYQQIGKVRKPVSADYQLLASNEIGFRLGAFDAHQPLVIDPVLRYSTYIGGGSDDYGLNMTIDQAQNVYVVGYTGSFTQNTTTAEQNRSNPTTLNGYPLQNPLMGDPDAGTRQGDFNTTDDTNGTTLTTFANSRYDACVTKVNSQGTDWTYSTYIGGGADDFGLGIAVDPKPTNPDHPAIFVTGLTRSNNWPLKVPLQVAQGGDDAFLIKLDDSKGGGAQIVFSTYLGGSGADRGRQVAVDGTGNIYVAGITSSTNFPVGSTSYAAFQPVYGGGNDDAFLVSIDASGSAFNYSTYFGGSGDEDGMPISGSLSASANFDYSHPNAPFNNAGLGTAPGATSLGSDKTVGLAVDTLGYAYLCGGTTSTIGQGFYVSPNAYQSVKANSLDAFVAKFDPSGQPVYSTYLGGDDDDAARSIAIDAGGNAYITGYTVSSNFPTLQAASTAPAFQGTKSNGADAFVTKLNPTGSVLVYSTYLGGNGTDIGNGIAVSSGGQAYIAGTTNSTNFPTKNYLQASTKGGADSFVTKLRPDASEYEYSTYVGDTSTDRGMAIVVDGKGQAYVVGTTFSGGFPTTQGARQGGPGGPFQDGNPPGYVPNGLFPASTTYAFSDLFVMQPWAPPFPASNLIVTDVQQTTVSLAWTDNSDNEDGFEIERKLGDASSGNLFSVVGAVGTNVVTFTDTGLIPTTTYTYRVRPFNQAVVQGTLTTFYGAYSNQLTITTLPGLPADPSNLVVTPIDKNRLQITWRDNSNNEAYFSLESRKVTPPSTSFTELVQIPAANSTGSTLTYTHTGLLPNTTYEYRVRAYNVAGYSGYAGPVQGTTLKDAPTTAPVLQNPVPFTSNSEIDLAWTYSANDQTGFKVYRAPDNGMGSPGIFQLIRTDTQGGAGPFTYKDLGLAAATTFYYKVLPYNASGDGSLFSNVVKATTLPDPPAGATNLTSTLTIAPVTPIKIVLNWTSNSGGSETGFKVYRSVDNFATSTKITEVASGVTTYTDADAALQPNTVYYYQVVAFNRLMGVGDSDATPSNVACSLTRPAAPVLSGSTPLVTTPAAPNGSTKLLLTWKDSNPTSVNVPVTPSNFTVQRAVETTPGSGTAGSFSTISASPTGTQGGTYTFTDTGLQANTLYFYQVSATNTRPASCTDPNSGGSSSYLGPAQGLTAPAAANLLTVTPSAPLTDLILTWSDPTQGTSSVIAHKIYRKDTTNGYALVTTVPAGTSTYTDAGLPGNENYTYKVVATNFNAGTQLGGDAPDSNTLTQLNIPSLPTNFTAVPDPNGVPQKNGNTQVDLTWKDASKNPSAFKVEYSTDNGTTWKPSPAIQTSVGAQSYQVTGLTPNTTYCFRVRGTNSVGDGQNASTCNVTTLNNRPAGPTGLTATAVSATEIDLKWADNSNNEDGFKIERVLGTSFAKGTNLTVITLNTPNAGATASYADTGLTPSTTYTYRVSAFNNGGSSDLSLEAGSTTFDLAPNGVTSFTATPQPNGSVLLTWAHDGMNVTGFRLERQVPAGQFSTLTLQPATSPFTFTDSSTGTNVTYIYRITPVNNKSNGPSTVSGQVLTYPAAPTNLTVSVKSQTELDLSWTDNNTGPGAQFVIERKLNPGDTFVAIPASPVTGTSFADTGLTPDTTYIYQVKSRNATGDSGYSNTASAHTLPNKPTAPDGLTVSTPSLPNGRTMLVLTWNDNSSNETGFKIERSPDGATNWKLVFTAPANNTSTDTYTDQGLLPATTYFYRVTATNAGGDSAATATASGTTLPNAPAAPTNLTVTVPAAPTGTTALVLNWADNSSNENGFVIERSADGVSGWSALGGSPTVTADTTTYTDSGLTSGTTYYYRVKATNAGGDSGYSNVAGNATLPTPPTAPTGLTVTVPAAPAGSSQLNLAWTAPSSNNATSIVVERSTDTINFNVIVTLPGNATGYTDGGLNGGTTYTYRIKASNAGGDSAYAGPKSASTLNNPPTAPSKLAVSNPTSSTLTLTWQETTSATNVVDSFTIQRRTGSGGYVSVGGPVSGSLRTYTDTALTPNTTYFYRVLATNNGGDSSPSNEATGTTLPNAPASPSNLKLTALSQTSVQAQWQDNSTNEDGFVVERSADGNTFTPLLALGQATTTGAGTTSYTDTGLTANTTYFYRVKAVNAGGSSGYAGPQSVKTLPNLPGAPANVTVSNATQNSLQISWTASAGTVDSYELQRKSGNGTFATVTSTSQTSYTDVGLSPNTTYTYQVRATNAAGSSAFAGPATGTTLPVLPSRPTGLVVTSAGVNSLLVSWVDNSSATDYSIEREVSGSNGSFQVVGTVTAPTKSFTDSNLQANTTYLYRVRGHNAAGYSDYSDTASGSTNPSAPKTPGKLQASELSPTSAGLSWVASDNVADGYKIERKLAGGTYALIATTTGQATTYTDSGLSTGSTYTYRVRAYNSGGESGNSNEASVLLTTGGKLKLSATSIKFASTVVGSFRTKTLTIKNVGKGILSGGITAPSAPFSITSGGAPFSLAPNQSVTVTVKFAPTAAGAASGSLTVTSSDPAAARQSETVKLTGSGAGSQAAK